MTTETLHWISWGLTTTGVILWVYWSGRSSTEKRIAVLEEKKADKNNGMDKLKEAVVRIEDHAKNTAEDVKEMKAKMKCLNPNWDKGDCE